MIEKEINIFDLNDEATVLDNYLIEIGKEYYDQDFRFIPNRRFPLTEIKKEHRPFITNKPSLPLYGMVLIRELIIIANLYVNGLKYEKYHLIYNGFKIDDVDKPYNYYFKEYMDKVMEEAEYDETDYLRTVTKDFKINSEHPIITKFLLNNFGPSYPNYSDIIVIIVELFKSAVRLSAKNEYLGRMIKVDIETYVLAIKFSEPIEADILSRVYDNNELDDFDNSFYSVSNNPLLDSNMLKIDKEFKYILDRMIKNVNKPETLNDVYKKVKSRKESGNIFISKMRLEIGGKPIVTRAKEFRRTIDEDDTKNLPTIQDSTNI